MLELLHGKHFYNSVENGPSLKRSNGQRFYPQPSSAVISFAYSFVARLRPNHALTTDERAIIDVLNSVACIIEAMFFDSIADRLELGHGGVN